jgi:hypothetical protein
MTNLQCVYTGQVQKHQASQASSFLEFGAYLLATLRRSVHSKPGCSTGKLGVGAVCHSTKIHSEPWEVNSCVEPVALMDESNVPCFMSEEVPCKGTVFEPCVGGGH